LQKDVEYLVQSAIVAAAREAITSLKSDLAAAKARAKGERLKSSWAFGSFCLTC
jgi:hypothetical protein